MADAGTLISYRGDQNLGFGTNADVPISTNKDLDVVNQAARDLLYQEAARNTLIYKQKLDERENLSKALSAGQVKVGKLLDKDRPVVTKLLDAQTDAFKQWMKKGANDLEGAAAYQKATQEAASGAAQAQQRWVDYTRESDEIAKETIPEIRDAKQKALDEYLGGFYNDFKPYQETFRYNPADLDKVAVQLTTPVYDKKNAVTGTDKYYSFNAAKTNAEDLYATDKGRLLARTLSNKLIQDGELLDAANAQLAKYNKERGLQKGDPDYANEIDPTKDTPAVMMAKYALSKQPQFLISERKSDNSLLDYRAAMGRLGLDYTKLNRQQIEDKYGADSALYQVAEAIRGGVKKTITIPGGKGIFGKAPQTREVVEIGDPNLIKEFATIDKEGNVTETPDAVQYDKDKNQLYLIYNKSDGTPDDSKTKSINASQYMGQVVRRLNPNKDIGGVNLEVTNQLRKYGGSLDELAKNYGKQTQPTTTNTQQPKAATGKTYKVGGYDYTEQEIIDAAKQLGMTKAAYMKKYGIK